MRLYVIAAFASSESVATIVKRNVPDARGLPEMTPVLGEIEADRKRADGTRPTCIADAAGRREREPIALADPRAADAERPDLQFRRDGQRYRHLGARTIRVANGEHDWEGACLCRNTSQVAGRAVALVADEAGVLWKGARDLQP